MHKTFKYLLITSSLLLMEGCATHTNFVKKYDSYVGHNISELIEHHGYPDSTLTLPNKNKVYIYEESSISTSPRVSIGIGYGMYSRYGFGGYGAEEIHQESCKLFLETNRKGIIVKWNSKGNSCVSDT